MPHRSRHRICLWVLLLSFGGMMGLLAIFSYRMDPFSLYQRSDYMPPLPPNPARLGLSSYSNITKARRIALEKPSRILLGSSIVDHGFRLPGSMAYWYNPYPELAQQMRDAAGTKAAGFYNAAIRGGGMSDMWDYLQFAYRNNPKLDSVILGVEYSMFYAPFYAPELSHVSLPGKQGVSLSFTLEYLLSPLALRSSYEILDASTDAPWIVRHVPLQEPLDLPISSSLTAVMERMWQKHVKPPLFFPSPADAVAPDKKLEIGRFTFSVWAVHHWIPKSGEQITKNLRIEEDFKHIVSFCRAHAIDLQVYRSPEPAVLWAMLERFGLQPSADDWYRKMATRTPVWDFADRIDFNPKAEAIYSTDTLHFSTEGGQIIFPAILNRRQNVARLVDAAHVEEAIAHRKAMLKDREAANPDIAEAIRALPVEKIKTDPAFHTTDLQSLEPMLLDPEYKGYRVVKVLHDVAVPTAIHPPYNGYHLVSGNYSGLLRSDDMGGIAAAIDHAAQTQRGISATRRILQTPVAR